MRHWIGNMLACVILGSAASLAAADVQSLGETDDDWAEADGSAPRPDAEAEAALRNARTAAEVLMADCAACGASEEGTLPGSGRGGRGTELLGPLEHADHPEKSGALLSGRSRPGQPCGLGIDLPTGVYLRADTTPGHDSYVMYARHGQSGRVYALDAEDSGIFFCENDEWIGQSGILAAPVPVTSGRNDLDGQDCGGGQIPRWTRLSSVEAP